MFVKTTKKAAITGFILTLVALGATTAAANSANSSHEKSSIPVTVSLSGLQLSDGPLYISVQTRDQYRGIKGFGEVVKTVTPGDMSVTMNIDRSGEYAVSVWHDLNNDGIFSMTETYQILDGWGASGDVSNDRQPTFDDVRVSIGGGGAVVPVSLIYPK